MRLFARLGLGRSVFGCALALLAMLALGAVALAQEAPGAPAAAPAASTSGGPLQFIMHFLDSLGWVFGPLLGLVSICLFAFVVLLMLDLRMSVIIPPGFVEEFTDTVNKRQFKQAFDLARNDHSYLGRVLTAGMSRLQYGLEDAREASMNMLDSIKSSKEQLNSYLSVIGTLGPLLGLVGTVFGMILAFMSMGKGGAINAPELAGSISKALCITLAGVGLAVPAIFFNAFFKNRITHVAMDCGNIADDLLTQMYHNSKKPAPPSGAAPGTVAGGNGPIDPRAGITPSKPG
jgi:biopolymer transport protein ExbB